MAKRLLSLDTGNGADDPAVAGGSIEIAPVYSHADGTTHIHASSKTYFLTFPASTVNLTVGQFYRFTPRDPAGKSIVALIPSGSGTLLFKDLVPVDPSTLLPSADPGPAWFVAAQQMQDGLSGKQDSATLADDVADLVADPADPLGVTAKIETTLDALPEPSVAAAQTLIGIGDSTMNQNGGPVIDTGSGLTAAPYNTFQSRGPVVWMLALLKAGLAFIANAGIGGQRADQVAARFAAHVVAHAPGWVDIQCGTNDVSQGRSIAQITTSLTSMYDAAKDAGIRVLANTVTTQAAFAGAVTSASRAIGDTTITVAGITTASGSTSIPVPSSAVGDILRIDSGSNAEDVTVSALNAGTGTYTVSALTKAHASGVMVVNKTKMAVLSGVNAWLDAYARTHPNVILADLNAVYADPATGGPATGVSIDGTHPSVDGAAKLGKAKADALDRHINPIVGRIVANDPTNYSPNPTMVGSGGSSSGLAASSGTYADGFTLFSAGSATETVVASKVARTDGLPGDWQQFVISGGVGIMNYQTATQTLSSLGLAVGDLLWAEWEFEGDDFVPASGAGAAIDVKIQWIGGSGTSPDALVHASGSDGVSTLWPAKGRFRTQAAPIPASTTGFRLIASIRVASGTCRLGRNRVVKGAIA